MKTFINKTLDTLAKSDVSGNSLVKVLIESTNNSLESNIGTTSTYNTLKKGLAELNSHLKNDTISNILEQFNKFEYSDENRINELNREADLRSAIETIKESNSYSNPIVMQNVILLEESLKTQPEFTLYGRFVDSFKSLTYDKAIQESVTKITNYINNNVDKLMVLDAINSMNKNQKMYENDIKGLSKMLISESYSSESIKHRLNGNLPILNDLANRLSVIESRNSAEFTLGSGNGICKISNTIAPTLKTGKNTVLTYVDDKFMAISTKELRKGSILSESKSSRVYEMDPAYIKDKYSSFYTLCESFYKMKFVDVPNGIKSTALKNFSIEFKTNESGKLNIYINDLLIEDPANYNFNEILTLESTGIKNIVSTVLNETSSIFNLEFIKSLTNEHNGKQVMVMELEGDYHICEKLNQVERVWKNDINEHRLHGYILENFNYDVSSIFQVKLDEQRMAVKALSERKTTIESNIAKLEEQIAKINTNLESGEIDSKFFGQLEDIREQLETKINSLREEFVECDLKKKELAH